MFVDIGKGVISFKQFKKVPGKGVPLGKQTEQFFVF